MKTLIALMVFTVGIVYFLGPIHKTDQGCMVHFDTSRGPGTFDLAAKDIDSISEGTREDRSLKPNWCLWFVCSYPKVKSSWVMTRDMTMYHIRDTLSVAEAKVQTCKPNFHARHH